MVTHRKNKPFRAEILFFLCFCIFFLATDTRIYAGSSVACAFQIRQFLQTGDIQWLLHSDHILFNGLCLLFYRFLHLVRVYPDPLKSAQILNAFLGALCVAHFFTLCKHLCKQEAASRWITLGFGLGLSFWRASTDGSCDPISLLFIILILRFLIDLIDGGGINLSLIVGISFGLCVLFNRETLLLFPIIILGCLLSSKTGFTLRKIILFLVGLFAILFLPTLFRLKTSGLHGIFFWIPLDFCRDAFQNGVGNSLREMLNQVMRSVLISVPNRLLKDQAIYHIEACLLILLEFGISFLLGWGFLRMFPSKPDRRSAVFLFLGLLLLTIEEICWPFEYKSIQLMISLFLACLASITIGCWEADDLLKGPKNIILAVCVICLGLANLHGQILPSRNIERNYTMIAAQSLAQSTNKKDLIILAGDGNYAALADYLSYFEDRQTLSIQSLSENNKNWEEYFRQKVKPVINQGGHVWVLDELITPGKPFKILSQRTRISQSQFDRMLDSYKILPGFIGPNGEVWELREKE